MIRKPDSPGTRSARLASVRLAFVLPASVLLAWTCAPADPEPVEVPAIDTLPADIALDSQSLPTYDPDDPFFGFDLDGTVAATTEQRHLALRLLNDGSEDVLVYADGGAGEVRIDSVAAGARTRVDLLTRATVVTLRSTSLTGRELRRVEITTTTDTVRDVVISATVGPEGVDRSPHTGDGLVASLRAM